MIGIVVVTHGQLAAELVNAARTIVGELPAIAAVSIGWSDEAAAAREAIERALAEVGGEGLVLQAELPADVFVNALAQSLDLSPVEKQSLLDCDTIAARYGRLLEILDFRLLERSYGRGGGENVH